MARSNGWVGWYIVRVYGMLANPDAMVRVLDELMRSIQPRQPMLGVGHARLFGFLVAMMLTQPVAWLLAYLDAR